MPASSPSRRRSQRERLIAALSVAACLLAAVVLVSAERPNQPPYFALRNARIVPVSGPVIENGTLVVANGLISALGTDVAIPPEAWVIDATGLTVYPGLIDALTTLGLPAEEERGRAATPSAGQQQPRREIAQGPEDRPATTSWENAADQIQPEDKRLENWRQAGFTSAVTAPDSGLVPGQAALINLAGERPGEMVVRTPVGLRINLAPPRGTRSFPNSLMGVFAYVKQLFIDAEHYGQASAIYENHPSGLERPAYDRTLEPVHRAVKEGWPVLLPATWAKEIHRAIRLGEEINANTLLYGAHQGYEVADVLARKKVPVLVSVKWPERPPDADPEAEEPLRELRLRDRAPSTPARFEKAGVKFAFYSDGLANPREILANVRKAIEAGLSSEAALRALTLSAAEIYGVANRLGSLEVGKIANLTVTDGDLFDEKTKVKMVFIDGRKYEVREPGRPTAPPVVNLTGTWTLTVDTRQGPQERTAELTMAEDGSLTGTITAPMGTQSLSRGWVSGHKFSFTVTFTMRGRPVDATYGGTVEGNRMTGTVSVGRATTEFTGTRPDKSSGDTARREGDE
jgi:imidazolonepropionase-like amidohydrolase